jgi:hypothetical protein
MNLYVCVICRDVYAYITTSNYERWIERANIQIHIKTRGTPVATRRSAVAYILSREFDVTSYWSSIHMKLKVSSVKVSSVKNYLWNLRLVH